MSVSDIIVIHLTAGKAFDSLIIPKQEDVIFDASTLVINSAFVTDYLEYLRGHKSKAHSCVMTVARQYLPLFPESCAVVPTLGEARDLIEMERIERDLGL